MKTLPLEMQSNITEWIPIGSLITNSTTKDEVLHMLHEREKDWNMLTYYWFAYPGLQFRQDIVIKVTISCNEYIKRIDVLVNGNTLSTWRAEDVTVPINPLSLPLLNGQMMYNKDVKVTIKDDGNVNLTKGIETLDVNAVKWENFVKTGRDMELREFVVNRTIRPDHNIIELLTNEWIVYIAILDCIKRLYNEGYWVYGGLLDHIINPNEGFNKVMPRTRVELNSNRLKITLGGIVSNVKDVNIRNILLQMGARLLD